ncbi:MAG: ABC transporter permease [Bacilli bacterium]
MRIRSVIKRILRQFRRDKRTLALLLLAPLFICTLLSFVFNSDELRLTVGVENQQFLGQLKVENSDHSFIQLSSSSAEERFEQGTLDAYITVDNFQPQIMLRGSSVMKNSETLKIIQQALGSTQQSNVTFFYGNEDMEIIDWIGPALIAFFIFFFVFLIAGVSFLRERTSGTLQRLLATPITRIELLLGYIIGFGIFAVFQSFVIAGYCTYVLGLYNNGSFLAISIVSVCIALTALCLGTFLSTFANNELQIIQFIPIVVVPQMFFSGIFPIEGMIEPLQWLAKIMPLPYASSALQSIIINGQPLSDVWSEIVILLVFASIFATLNVLALRKHRAW